MGDVDVARGTVSVRTEAGVENYLDDTVITLEGRHSRDPTGRAVRTGEMQVLRDVQTDSEDELLRARAEEYGYRSAAAVPVEHEGTIYGVLNVYTDRSRAFDGEERTVIDQLGDVVGHAIAAVERKRALMTDEVVEVEFLLSDMLETLDVPVGDGTIRFERTVPVGDGSYVEYGTASPDMLATVEAIPDAVEHWKEVNVIGDPLDEVRFEVRLAEPPLSSAMASKGSRVEEAVIEGGDYRFVVQIPQGADVRRLVESVKQSYPGTEFVSQRQVAEPIRSPREYRHAVFDELTERQRTVVEMAYFAGYFAWPRGSTGEEVAASLGISPPTFHQHLRKAEQTILGALLERAAVTE